MSEPVITPQETFKSLVNISSKLDTLIEGQKTNRTNNEKLERRVAAVERKFVYFSGFGAGIMTILTVFGGKIREAIFG